MPILCWDAGHGGYDPGACGNGLQEKDITLDIVLRGKPIAEANGITVVLTRSGDYAPGHYENNLNAELGERVRIANVCKADLFLSTHVNAGGGEGDEILVQHDGGNAEKFANIMLPLLTAVGNWYCRGVKEQNVEVLRDTNMPAALTECGFIDSKVDTDKLKDPNFRQALAEAHVQGQCIFFGLPFLKGGSVMPDPKVAPVAVVDPDPDVWLTVRVRTSKSDALVAKIIADGFACKKLPLA